VDHAELIDVAESEADAILVALRAGPLDVAVPTCPGWTLADLAGHLGEVTRWRQALHAAGGGPLPPRPQRPDQGSVVDWFESLVGELIADLRATPPDALVWTFVRSEKTARFIARRVANELAVHRVDAQAARGGHGPLARDHAPVVIDEMFMIRNDSERAEPHVGSGQRMHLHGNEGDEWLITLGPERIEVTHTHAKGDLALRGDVSDLALLLYQRPTLGEVQRFGDESVLDLWYREFTF
jgi:uncharacterized protein (TIGR03083 family)